jgi:hypothetical protein
MGKEIILKTCFGISGSDSNRFALPQDVKTFKDLLAHIGGKIDFNFVDPETGRVEEDLEIILNEKDIWFYPDAMGTELKDGDVVEIYLLPLGGG